MTTLYSEMVTCAVCGTESRHTAVGSTNAFGSMDMDMRPPEMKRSTMRTWIQECPSCSYCAADLASLIDEAESNLKRADYQAMLTDTSISQLARRFGASSLLNEWAQNFLEAAWDSIHAAWECDDINSPEKAIRFRERAYSLFLKVLDADQVIMQEPGTGEVLLADICRRTKHWQKAVDHCRDGMNKTSNDFIKKLLTAELRWADSKDSSCHKVQEAALI